jgi:hypothetical protein
MLSGVKGRSRNLASKVKGIFTRSRPPSRAPSPNDPPVDTTQGGNDEGVSWICCSSNALIVRLGTLLTSVAEPDGEGDCSPLPSTPALIDRIEHIQTPPEWDLWQVDESDVADLKNWFDQHGDTTWSQFARNVDDALKTKSVTVVRGFLGLIPCPFSLTSLVDGIIGLVQLVVVCYFYLSF